MPINQEGTMVERTDFALERSKPERIIALVTESEAVVAILELETAPITTLMPNPTFAIASQDIPTTPTTAKTLLLLTSGPQVDRTVTLLVLDLPSPQSLTLKSYLLKPYLM